MLFGFVMMKLGFVIDVDYGVVCNVGFVDYLLICM